MAIKRNQAGLWVLAFDLHYPKLHRPSFNAMMDFIKNSPAPIRGFVFGGDMFDNAAISHHNVRRILFREPGAYAKDTKGFEQNVLNPIEALLPKTADRIWINGNHEAWTRQLVEENPELEGTVEREEIYGLIDRGWVFKDTGQTFNIGKLLVLHGETLKGSNHAKNSVEMYAQSTAYGHFHTVQRFTKVLPHSKSDKWVGHACAALCETNPVYLRNAPTAWLNGFAIVEVDEEGNFNLYDAIVTKGKFRFAGRTYGAKNVK